MMRSRSTATSASSVAPHLCMFRPKSDKKAVRMVFVGYAENRKAYRFLDQSTDRIVISRDAKFLEEELKSRESVSGVGPALGTEEIVELREEESPAEEGTEASSDEAEENDATLVPDSDDSVYDDAEEEVLGEVSSDSILAGFPPDLRRSNRSTQGVPPERYSDQAKAVRLERDEPRNLKEAKSSSEAKQWQRAMEAEIKSHADNGTWELVELPAGRKPVGSRWVFKIKRDAVGNVVKHKARLVAQGYTQQFGVDFDEVFAPVISQTTFRTLLAVASKQLFVLHQFDVKTAYLHGALEEEVFMRQAPGFAVAGKENLVCRLRKSIYGLKQSARCWNHTLHEGLLDLQFKQSRFDPCLYTRSAGKHVVYVLIYVDDIVVGCKEEVEIQKVFQSLRKKFDITNLGALTYFLGMEIDRTDGVYSICLSGYIQKVAERFEMQNAKPSKTPMDCGYVQLEDRGQQLPDSTKYRSLVGALLYIAVHARPDIAACTSILGRRVSDPFEADWTAAKRVIRYLLGTKGWKLHYTGADGELIGYTDADWAGDQQTRKSTTGYCFLLGGAAVSWISRRQSSVTLSSMEAEYVSLSEACKEAVWLRSLLDDLNEPQRNATVLNEDNQSCIAFVSSERATRRSKHIATREQYVKELCERNQVRIVYCPSEEQAADILTKPLGSVKQLKFAGMIGMAVPGAEVPH